MVEFLGSPVLTNILLGCVVLQIAFIANDLYRIRD